MDWFLYDRDLRYERVKLDLRLSALKLPHVRVLKNTIILLPTEEGKLLQPDGKPQE